MKKHIAMLVATLTLASCSGSFSKGDQVIAIDNQHQGIGYCEGTVVSTHDSTVIIGVQDCKNGGVPNAGAGMNPFQEQDVYTPEKGFALIAARKKVLGSNAKPSTPSQYDEAIDQAKAAHMPFTAALLKLQKITAQANAFNVSNVTTLQQQKAFLHIIKSNSEDIESDISDFFKAIHAINGDVSDRMENLFARKANGEIVQIIALAYKLPILPTHPNAWKKMKVDAITIANTLHKANIDALKANGFNASWAKANDQMTRESNAYMGWFQIEPTLNEAWWLNPESISFTKSPEKTVGVEYNQYASKIANKIYANESPDLSQSNAKILADIKKAMAPFGTGGNAALKNIAANLNKNRASAKVEKPVLKRLMSAKEWRMHIQYPYNSYENVEFHFHTDPQKGLTVTINDAGNPNNAATWHARIKPNGDVALLGARGYNRANMNYLWENKHFMGHDKFRENFRNANNDSGFYIITYVAKHAAEKKAPAANSAGSNSKT